MSARGWAGSVDSPHDRQLRADRHADRLRRQLVEAAAAALDGVMRDDKLLHRHSELYGYDLIDATEGRIIGLQGAVDTVNDLLK